MTAFQAELAQVRNRARVLSELAAVVADHRQHHDEAHGQSASASDNIAQLQDALKGQELWLKQHAMLVRADLFLSSLCLAVPRACSADWSGPAAQSMHACGAWTDACSTSSSPLWGRHEGR